MLSAFALALLGPTLAGDVRPLAGQAREPIQTPAGLIHPERLLLEVRKGAGVAALEAAHARAGGRVLQDLPQIGWQIVEVDPRRLFEAREAYLREPAIARADFDRAKRLAYVPNDPF